MGRGRAPVSFMSNETPKQILSPGGVWGRELGTSPWELDFQWNSNRRSTPQWGLVKGVGEGPLGFLLERHYNTDVIPKEGWGNWWGKRA